MQSVSDGTTGPEKCNLKNPSKENSAVSYMGASLSNFILCSCCFNEQEGAKGKRLEMCLTSFPLEGRRDLGFWECVETPEFAIHLTRTLWLTKDDFLVCFT